MAFCACDKPRQIRGIVIFEAEPVRGHRALPSVSGHRCLSPVTSEALATPAPYHGARVSQQVHRRFVALFIHRLTKAFAVDSAAHSYIGLRNSASKPD
jgi:hypothetical protein